MKGRKRRPPPTPPRKATPKVKSVVVASSPPATSPAKAVSPSDSTRDESSRQAEAVTSYPGSAGTSPMRPAGNASPSQPPEVSMAVVDSFPLASSPSMAHSPPPSVRLPSPDGGQVVATLPGPAEVSPARPVGSGTQPSTQQRASSVKTALAPHPEDSEKSVTDPYRGISNSNLKSTPRFSDGIAQTRPADPRISNCVLQQFEQPPNSALLKSPHISASVLSTTDFPPLTGPFVLHQPSAAAAREGSPNNGSGATTVVVPGLSHTESVPTVGVGVRAVGLTQVPEQAPIQVNANPRPEGNLTSTAAAPARSHAAVNQTGPRTMSWADCVSGKSHPLQHRGDQFRLDSGEVCVQIPNTVITRNKKAWASFVLGQFHGTLPSMGALHAILNGIWSSKAKDITISRVSAQSVLIKIPNSATRKRILEQGIWHIEGQTMFVCAWEPGLNAEVPEMKEAPVWVDFKNVPPHFFSAEGLEYIASMVGRPLHLHPRTAAMTHLEVARVFTLVDLKKPLPEAVNVMFESGEIHRIEVSCQWLPPLCTHCHQYGHSLRRCPTAPVTCTVCKSTTHSAEECRRFKQDRPRNRRRSPPPPKRPTAMVAGPSKRSTTLSADPPLQVVSTSHSDPTPIVVEEQTGRSSPPRQQIVTSSPQVEYPRQPDNVVTLASQTMEDPEIETLDQLMGTPSILPLHKGKKQRGKGAPKEARTDNHSSDRESTDFEAEETAEERLDATVFKRSKRPSKSSKRRGLLGLTVV